jgi:hypothetical protein
MFMIAVMATIEGFVLAVGPQLANMLIRKKTPSPSKVHQCGTTFCMPPNPIVRIASCDVGKICTVQVSGAASLTQVNANVAWGWFSEANALGRGGDNLGLKTIAFNSHG